MELKEKLAFAPDTKDADIKQEAGMINGAGIIKDAEKVVINPSESEAAGQTGIAEIQKNLNKILDQVVSIEKKLETLELRPVSNSVQRKKQPNPKTI
ncbi:MAG: hypothetical protein KF862_07320 [Chitinophagaceae bacterium]|nr:hypothetical protein [Chitinophagaceae bacterium]